MNDSMDNKIDYIQKVIVITGKNNAGKTTYAAELYKWLYQEIKPKSHLYAFWNKYLFKEAGENDNINCNFCHYINNNKISKSNISANLYVDFMAVINDNDGENSIIIISEGDKKDELEPKLDLLLRDKNHPDYNNNEKVEFERNNITLVCCVRSSVKKYFNEWIKKNTTIEKIEEIDLQTCSDIAKSIINNK